MTQAHLKLAAKLSEKGIHLCVEKKAAAKHSRPARKNSIPPGPKMGISTISSRQARPAPLKSAQYRLAIALAWREKNEVDSAVQFLHGPGALGAGGRLVLQLVEKVLKGLHGPRLSESR